MGPSLPMACAPLGGVARAAYMLELDWLVTRLMTLCRMGHLQGTLARGSLWLLHKAKQRGQGGAAIKDKWAPTL